jgi:hypothetical protein
MRIEFAMVENCSPRLGPDLARFEARQAFLS